MKEPPEPPEEEHVQEGPRMYFTETNQLLSIYKELEQNNLFLIQNSQESEEALEELRGNFRKTKVEMEAETESLHQQIAELKSTISREAAKGQVLKNQTIQNSDGVMSFNGQTVTLEDLYAKVTEVYVQCGFDRDASAGILQLLTNIEVRLDEYLGQVRTIARQYFLASCLLAQKTGDTCAADISVTHLGFCGYR